MHEAIDYNVLSWVRQELGETLKQARLKLEAYVNSRDDADLLHDCASYLHQARGTLQMVELKGADRMAAEMEEVITDLLQGTLVAEDETLELLLQAFLQLPDYLSRIRSGQQERPSVLLPVINNLRASRGSQPLHERVFFYPNLSARVPVSVYDPRSVPAKMDMQDMARTARVHFQSGLLEWYRGGEGRAGLQALFDVLASLQESAGSEPAARVWWVAAGLAEAVIAGELAESPEVKQLFGQLDRQIKRLLDFGEGVFPDVITDDLLTSMLFELSGTGSCPGRIEEIKSTYGLNSESSTGSPDAPVPASVTGCGSELLQTVAVAVLEEIGKIRQLLDEYAHAAEPEARSLASIADALHVLGNTLDMAGLGTLCTDIAAQEQLLRGISEGACEPPAAGFGEVAAALIVAEEAVSALADNHAAPGEPDGTGSAAFRQGLEAVVREVLAGIARAKEAITEFSLASGDSGALQGVPEILQQASGSLQLAGQERAAAAAGRVGQFVAQALLDGDPDLDEARLDALADALCSVEYYVEALLLNASHSEAVLDVAEERLDRLSCMAPDTVEAPLPGQDLILEDEAGPAPAGQVPAAGSGDPLVTGLQVIGEDADEEILAIFIEEADEELAKLHEYIPAWLENPEQTQVLAEVRRAFHTLKGSGRMMGALAIGEFSWVFENLINQVIEGAITPDDSLKDLLAASSGALGQLIAQVKDRSITPEPQVDGLARQAVQLSQAGGAGAADVDAGSADLPVLSAGADEEIVGIFLEEAAEQCAVIADTLPGLISFPDDGEALATVRRCFHTLKGSGRMTGAMLLGEFCWAIEELLNRLGDGSIRFSAAVAALLEQCGESLPQLVSQIGEGTAPVAGVHELIARAIALARGETPERDVGAESSDGEADTHAAASGDDAPDEAALLDVFTNECRDHLEAINAFLEEGDEPQAVSESLYRAIHTLAGISESAGVVSIQGLAGDLNACFDGLYRLQQPVSREAIAVLRDGAGEIQRLLEQLPDLSIDEQAMSSLYERMANLLHPEAVQDDDLPEPDAAPAEDETRETGQSEAADPYTGLDEELFEIFIEEAAEIIDASETVLRSWSGDPDNRELLAELQRQLHTLKGGARMVDIQAIGNLSHALESLLIRVGDGAIDTSGKLFALLHAAQDRLAEMLDQVKARELPGEAADLEAELENLAAEPVMQDKETATGDQAVPEPAAVMAAEADAAADEQGSPAAADAAETDVGDGPGEAPAGAAAQEDGEETCADAVAEQPAEAAADEQGSSAAADAAETDAGDGPGEAPAGAAAQEDGEETCADAVAEQPVAENTAAARPPATAAPLPKRDRRKRARARGEQVRVQSGLLDDMVNHAGEINIYRSRMEQQISDYRFNLAELDQTINRLRDQLRQLEIETEIQILFRYEQEPDKGRHEFDPLEMDRYSNLQQLSRSLMESISDLRSLQDLMERTTRESETLLLQQSRVSTDLQDGLMRTRMIPFAGLASRLRRIVRQTARQLGKKAELELQGSDGEMDRTIIDRIVAPLEHMLRNAVAHGIEPPEIRSERGKSEAGNITVSFDREGPEIVLRIEDDGAGMDIEAIRTRALECGLMAADSGLNDDDIMQFVLQTGFSTAGNVTQISGRGVGLDVVNSEVKQLGGSLHIESTAGKGSVFTLRLPYTLAINQVLLVTAGEQDFCIPLGSIEGVVRAIPHELTACYAADENILEYAGNQYQLKHLGSTLGTGGMNLEQAQARIPVLLVRIGEKRVALQVEALLGSREIVIKPVGPQLSTVDGISGATILGDGRVVLILDMAAVTRMNTRIQLPDMQAPARNETRLVVMVVDDSITVRKVTRRLLERNGFKVLTAKDGVDALGQLQYSVPDMMLLDIEMPRMDGFELATHMRNDANLKHMPIIMITSRTGDKHRQRAHEIGVNNYLGKPYQENDLLDSIHRIIGAPTSGD